MPRISSLLVSVLIFAMPSVACADQFTERGLNRIVYSINNIALAIAFSGVAIAIGIFKGLQSRRQGGS